jgi:demethylmenaquinone methyltransferase/2-methoxy-6-polyprenyl-1,4-benzoquinol methylase
MATQNYGRVARVYESLGQIYSGGQIYAAKASQAAEVRAGDRVLYMGIGPGEEALLAARRGARVTGIDLAPQMLRIVEGRLQREGLAAELICGDVLAHDRREHYDVVVLNFFLNVFSEPMMQQILAHAATLVKPGGKVLISDFAAARGGPVQRFVQEAYWGVTNLFYYLLRLAAWHRIYDYARYFEPLGLELQRVTHFRPYKIGPGGFYAITAVRRMA